MRRHLDAGTAQVVDARAAARFRGEAPEPVRGDLPVATRDGSAETE